MFRPFYRVAEDAAPSVRTRFLLRRAALFGAGLLMLWLAVHLAPSRSAPGPAAGAAEEEEALRPRRPGSALLSAGNLAALALLLGGAGLAFVLRRRSRGAGGGGAPIESLGQMTLAPNQQLRLVRCSGEVLLLGVTAGQITLLKAYASFEASGAALKESEGVSSDAARARLPAVSAPAEASFAALLRQQFGRSLNVQQTGSPC